MHIYTSDATTGHGECQDKVNDSTNSLNVFTPFDSPKSICKRVLVGGEDTTSEPFTIVPENYPNFELMHAQYEDVPAMDAPTNSQLKQTHDAPTTTLPGRTPFYTNINNTRTYHTQY